jgi:predicted oxidoreductase
MPMKTISLGISSLISTRLAYGCWRIAGSGSEDDLNRGRRAVRAAYEAGYTLFDHADIYGRSACESLFGEVLKTAPEMRDRILIATKCGIRFEGDPAPGAPFRYDFSREHILRSCDQSLRRLGVDTIDLYQLHRPDYLMDPAEVAGAFAELKQSGKVREFGVSNFRPSQLHALQQACDMPLIVNQVEISLANLQCFEDGTLDQCLSQKITPLAWSPLGGGQLGDGGKDLLPWQEKYLTDGYRTDLDEVAAAHHTTRTVVALAWLLKHPAGIIPIVGSTDPERIRGAVAADALELSREAWYRLLKAARGEPLP